MLKMKIAILMLTLVGVLYVQFCMDVNEVMSRIGVTEQPGTPPAP
jgi:hypothetical protein